MLLAMLWAVSARPQRESTEGTPGEVPGAPPSEGINALIIRTSGEFLFHVLYKKTCVCMRDGWVGAFVHTYMCMCVRVSD